MMIMRIHFIVTLVLALASSISYAIGFPVDDTPTGVSARNVVKLQGGSQSSVQFWAPHAGNFTFNLNVISNNEVPYAQYHIYPKGKRAGSTGCDSNDSQFPCYEAAVDLQVPGKRYWWNLGDTTGANQWNFTKEGFISVDASNLDATQTLKISTLVKFNNADFYLGKNYQGGFIFYLDDSGEHGLIAAPTDQSEGVRSVLANASFPLKPKLPFSDTVGSGKNNSQLLIQVQGRGNYAAMVAASLELGGYSDWYLPSDKEMGLMIQNLGPTANVGGVYNIGGFAGDYVTSTVDPVSLTVAVWSANNASASLLGYPDVNYRVRAIRSF